MSACLPTFTFTESLFVARGSGRWVRGGGEVSGQMFKQDFYSDPDQDEAAGEFHFIFKKMTGPIPHKNSDKRNHEGDGSDYNDGGDKWNFEESKTYPDG